MVIDYVKNKNLWLLGENIAIHIWSDCCPSQFRPRYVFSLISNFDGPYDITWYYNGKGPVDGLGGTIKNLVLYHVKLWKVVIYNPKEFSLYADKITDNITSPYMALDNILEEPTETEEATGIPQTLQILKFKRRHDNRKLRFLEFYEIASADELIFKQYYPKRHRS